MSINADSFIKKIEVARGLGSVSHMYNDPARVGTVVLGDFTTF